MKIEVGQRVAYARDFLRSAGIYAGPIAHARGTVREISQMGIATVDWADDEVPSRVRASNLWPADKLHIEPR